MKKLSERDRELIWHPYTQMQQYPESIGIVKAEGAYLYSEDGKRYIDAISSWWVNIHGHSNPYIGKKVSEQFAVLDHCIFAGFTHQPAIELAEKLVSVLPLNAPKVFYSDNGSTAVEVALKMAMQYWQNRGEEKRTFIALENSYHGDTFGAMSVSERGLFTQAFSNYLFDVTYIPFPSKENEQRSVETLISILQKEKVVALILEPLIQGAAGMQMYSPEVLEKLFDVCKKNNTLIIADEVMTGFGRTGKLFACDYIKLKPDIICLSKGLTGGIMPLGVTACTTEVYNAFLSDDTKKTFYHGHSFTANPLACAAASASFDLLTSENCIKNIERLCLRQKEFVKKNESKPHLKNIRCFGTILALEIDTPLPTSYQNTIKHQLYHYFLSKNILMRPLGNIIYVLPPYCISDEDLMYIYDAIEHLLTHFDNIIT